MRPHTVNPYAETLYCDIRAPFRLVDKTAATDTTPTAKGFNMDITQLDQTHDGTEKLSAKWATLEPLGWPLNGTCDIMPDDVSGLQTGAWSEPSGADGVFESEVSITYPFTTDHSSYGFTLLFDEAANWYPRSVKLSAYNSVDEMIGSATIECTSSRQVVDLSVSGYREIVVQFLSTWLPYQCVHLAENVFGIVETFDNSNTTQATILYEIDPRGKTLPCGEMVVSFNNSDGKYNQRSPNSLFAYLQKGQPFDSVQIGLGETKNLEYISMGKQFYYAKSKAKDSSMTASITAYDLLYQMDKGTYRKGVKGTDTVANLVNSVLSDSGTGLTANIPAEIGSLVIGANIPLVSHREAIRLIAQAARCVAFINRENELQFAEIATGTSVDTLNETNMEEWPDITTDDAVNTVNVTVYGFYNKSLDSETVYSGTRTVNGTEDVWIEYDPTDNPSASVSGGTLNSATYYLRVARLNITASGDVTITVTGLELKTSKTTYSANNITGDETEQSFNVKNELVTSTAIASAIATYQLGLSRLTYPAVEMGNPARELVDTVTITDAYGGAGDAVVTKEKYTFDGGLSCEVEAVG